MINSYTLFLKLSFFKKYLCDHKRSLKCLCIDTTLKALVLNICMALKRAVFNMRNFMKNPTHHLLVAEIYGV
jgi:hypothetical protein